MQVRIGVQFVPRELVVDTRQSGEEVQRALAEALAEEHGVLVLDDVKGGRVVVPADRVGYLEIGEDEARRVGFGGNQYT
ncbi:DUF3107 domain-containing protein [Actinomadura parmotrematis]|uniref:DUF3107 domain-containing protein n=1 Tax=Actinomadura parmotrematis TaxID=2864039 RepID=A0ABS7FLQ7_9ACTN|nr:DUF3107 domain-containing protein [Actinomadura parmotrematis]MBW8481306.1 DUF3107 domain-containing protein [Actinomadura parmotrematis]